MAGFPLIQERLLLYYVLGFSRRTYHRCVFDDIFLSLVYLGEESSVL